MPHKPRKGVPFYDEETEEEAYCAAPFNMNAPDVEAPLPTSFTEDGEEVTGNHSALNLTPVKLLCPMAWHCHQSGSDTLRLTTSAEAFWY